MGWTEIGTHLLGVSLRAMTPWSGITAVKLPVNSPRSFFAYRSLTVACKTPCHYEPPHPDRLHVTKGFLSHEQRCHAAYDAVEDAGATTASSFAIWHPMSGHESSKGIRDTGKEEQLQKCGMLTGMSISQPRWCHCSVMEELSNSGSSSKWRFSMATARAPPFSAVPQICKVRREIPQPVCPGSYSMPAG